VENRIAVVDRSIGERTVLSISARDLHTFLESRADFTTWMKRQIERVRMVEARDYLLHSFVEQLPSGAKSKIDYFMTLEAAKHVAMMSGSDRGHEVREYFLECERQREGLVPAITATLADPVALRGLLLGYTERVVMLEAENRSLRPKAEFHDAVVASTNCQTIQQVAKVFGTGPNRLFNFLRSQRMLTRQNLPMQEHVDAGRFRVVEGHFKDKHGDRQTYTRTLVTGKGIAYIQRKLTHSGLAGPSTREEFQCR
jgi:anti-repressor protein